MASDADVICYRDSSGLGVVHNWRSYNGGPWACDRCGRQCSTNFPLTAATLVTPDPRDAELSSLRSALSSAREEARALSERVKALDAWAVQYEELRKDCLSLREERDAAREEARRLTEERNEALRGMGGALADLEAMRTRAESAESSARRLRETVERKDVALRAANAAMNHMGDVLNEMDAVEPEDEEKTSAAFALVRIEIGEAMPGDEERARAALGSSGEAAP